jgi:hypothetical protein
MNRLLACGAAMVSALALGSAGCIGGATRPEEQAAASASPFEGRLLEIARSYESYGMPDEKMRLTNVICDFSPDRFIQGLTPADRIAQVSSASDATPHGQKLYFLFVKEPRPVGQPREGQPATPEPVGQVVVKEAWVPEEVQEGERTAEAEGSQRKLKVRRDGQWVEEEVSFDPYVRSDGRLYHAKEKAGLFVLFKVDPGTPDTDGGWVYGTVTPDGKHVTSAGRVASCMGCHREAPYDRLFTAPARLFTPDKQ